MHVSYSVFTEARFWVMVAVSVVLPFSIYGVLIVKRAISRFTVLVLGFTLVAIAGVDVFFLQRLATLANATPSLADDVFFVSELRVALFLLPALFAGLGINVISHVLTTHLAAAEKRFNEEHGDSTADPQR